MGLQKLRPGALDTAAHTPRVAKCPGSACGAPPHTRFVTRQSARPTLACMATISRLLFGITCVASLRDCCATVGAFAAWLGMLRSIVSLSRSGPHAEAIAISTSALSHLYDPHDPPSAPARTKRRSPWRAWPRAARFPCAPRRGCARPRGIRRPLHLFFLVLGGVSQ